MNNITPEGLVMTPQSRTHAISNSPSHPEPSSIRRHISACSGHYCFSPSQVRSHFELAKEARFKMAKRVSIFAAFVNVLVASSMAAKCPGNANYTLTWKASWTRDNHPNTPLPSGAHFSNLIGCTHGSDYIMWRRGMNASAGVKSVAELGKKTNFVAVVFQVFTDHLIRILNVF